MLRCGTRIARKAAEAAAAGGGAAAEVLRRLTSADATVTLDAALAALEAHGADDAEVATAALRHVVALDVDDAASAEIARRGLRAVLEAGRRHPAAVADDVCRCIANMAMVPAGSSPSSAATTENSGNDSAANDDANAPAGVVTFASELQRAGAVRLVLAVLERGEALSARGRARASLALLNLCMFDDAAAREAAESNGLATVTAVLSLATAAAAGSSAMDVDPADLLAVESATAVTARLLSLQVAEDSATALFYYQRVAAATVDALALVLHSDLGISTEHKAWEALRLVSSEPTNHAMLFAALHRADGAAGTRVLQKWTAVTLEAFRTWVPGTTDLEVAHQQQLRWQITMAGLETLAAVTHASAAAVPEDANGTHTTTSGGDSAMGDDDGEDTVRFSANGIEPDAAPAATSALAALSSGTISRFIISLLTSSKADALAPRSSDHASGRDESVVLGCMNVLVNLADSDPYVPSANCVAAVMPFVDPLMSANNGAGSSSSAARYSSTVLDRALTLLWNILNHQQGADAVATLEVPRAVRRLMHDPLSDEATRLRAGRLEKKIVAIVENPRYAKDKR